MQDLIITNAGQALMAKLIAGETTANFTRMLSSSHDYSGVELTTLTSLEDVKQDVLVSGISVTSDTTVEVLARMDNTALTEGYYIRTIGLYAADEDGNVILYAVSIADTNADWMPAFGGTTPTGYSYTFNVKVSNSSAITLVIDPAAVPTMEQVSALETIVGTSDISAIADDLTGAVIALDEDIEDVGDRVSAIESVKDFFSASGFHNAVARCKDITKYWNDGSLQRRIKELDDVYVGDYWTASLTFNAGSSGVSGTPAAGTVTTWRIGEFDPYLHSGDTEFNPGYHTALIIPDQAMCTGAMNSSHTTANGLVASVGYTSTRAAIDAKLATLFTGANGRPALKTFRNLLTNAMNASGYNRFGSAGGCANGWSWYDNKSHFLKEAQVYGTTVWSSSGHDTGIQKTQIPLFAARPDLINPGRYWWWLGDIASSSGFCATNYYGDATYTGAGYVGSFRLGFVID